MFETTLDLLWFSLSIFIVSMTILLSLLIIKLINLIDKIQKIVALITDITEILNNYIWKPVKYINAIKDFLINIFTSK